MKLNGDQRQAVQDAIEAILKSRMQGIGPGPGQGPMPTPPGPITVGIDPKLKDPKKKGNNPDDPDSPPIEIFDPKGLLQQKSKDNQLKQQQQKSNTTYHGPNDPANKPDQGNSNGGGGEQGPDKPDQQKGDDQGQQGQKGQGQQQGQQGQQGGSNQGGEGGEGSQSGTSDATKAQGDAGSAQSSADAAEQAANTAQNLVDKLGKAGGAKAQQKADQAKAAADEAKQAAAEAQQAAQEAQQAEANGDTKGAEQAAKKAEKAAQKAADAAAKATDAAQEAGQQAVNSAEKSFKDGWNSTLSKFDNDNTSDADLEKAKEEAQNNPHLDPDKKKGILDAVEAIKNSRRRPFEIDQKTADDFKEKGLMLPKNTKILDDDPDETPEEKAARVERIKKDLTGKGAEDTLHGIETDNEMRELKELDKQAELERAQQLANRKRTPAKFSNFENDLLQVVNQQVAEEEDETTERSYLTPNPLSKATGLAVPGERNPLVTSPPLIFMFYDQSWSWDESDIKVGDQAVTTLDSYVDSGQIELVKRYFANTVHDRPDPT